MSILRAVLILSLVALSYGVPAPAPFVPKMLRGVQGGVKNVVRGAQSAIANIAEADVAEGVAEAINGVGSGVKEVIGGVGGTVQDVIVDARRKIGNKVTDVGLAISGEEHPSRETARALSMAARSMNQLAEEGFPETEVIIDQEMDVDAE